MMTLTLSPSAKTIINTAIAKAQRPRAAGERMARYILARPEIHPVDVVEDARVVLGISGKEV